MRNWFIGIAAFLLWSAGSSYWYVCKIKGLCPDVALSETYIPISIKENKSDSDLITPSPITIDTAIADSNIQETTSNQENFAKESIEQSNETSVPEFTVLFAFAKPIPEQPEKFEAYIESIKQVIQANPKKKVLLEGYTDDTAARENNLALSERRCEAIAKILREKGISDSRIVKSAKGEANPVATNETQAGRRLNRRVVLSIID